MARFLLANGADVEAEIADDRRASMFAYKNNHRNVVGKLVRNRRFLVEDPAGHEHRVPSCSALIEGMENLFRRKHRVSSRSGFI